MKISTVLERGHLQQSIEVIRWDKGPLKIVLIMARSWNSRTWNSHFDCLSQIPTQFMTNFNGPRPHLMTSMICWRRPLSKTMLNLIVALTLFELETKTFGQSTMVRFETKLEDYQSFKLLSLILAISWYTIAGLNLHFCHYLPHLELFRAEVW